jgi:hypothetical protein
MQETSLLTQFRLCPSRGLSRSIELNAENNDVLTYVKVLVAHCKQYEQYFVRCCR